MKENPDRKKSFVQDIFCPGCNSNYVGKSDRTLRERRVNHAWNDKDSFVFSHLNESTGVQHMFETGKLTPSLLTNNIIDDEFDLRSSRVNLVK